MAFCKTPVFDLIIIKSQTGVLLKTPICCFPGKKIKNVRRFFFLIKIYISAFWGYQNAGWETREKGGKCGPNLTALHLGVCTQNADVRFI